MPSQDETIDRYSFKLIERLIDNVTFEDNQANHKSEDFALEREKKRIAQCRPNELLFVENEEEEEEEEGDIRNIAWPTVKEFSQSLAAEKIDEFIKSTWQFDNCWLYSIDHVETIEKQFSTIYNYRACWSIPTRRRPIPRFTASVYFTFDVSKVKPKDSIVDVFYVFETQKLVHRAGSSRFRQQWLNDIISMKESLIRECKF